MATLQSKKSYSRQKARKKIKQKFPLLITEQTVVHHIDHNPLNNDVNNLRIMNRSDHIKYHLKLYWKEARLKFLSRRFMELERLIKQYNLDIE